MQHAIGGRPATATCARCGAPAGPADRFCGRCGWARPGPPPHVLEPDTVAIPVQRFAVPHAAGLRPVVPPPPAYGAAPGAPLGPPQLPAWVRAVPPLIWAGIGVAVIVFFVGLGTYSANSALAESCTVSDYGRWSVIEDTPSCDAATDDRDFGRWLMTIGGAAAIGLPLRALVKPGRPRTPAR